MRHPRPTCRGFTIAEMLISLALLALIMLAAALALQAAQTSHEYNREKSELVARARGVLDRIAHDVRRSKAVAFPDDHTIVITTTEDDLHTYAWDTQVPGHITYVQTVDLVASDPVELTGFVQSFTVSDQAPSSQMKIILAGDHAHAEAIRTMMPRKSVF